MLLLGFTGFEDVIIVFVTSQPQNIYFKKFNKNWLQQAKNLTSITYQSVFRYWGKFAPPLPVQIGCKNSPVHIGLRLAVYRTLLYCTILPSLASRLQYH